MAPLLAWYDDTDTLLASFVMPTDVTAGVATAATELRYWNHKGAPGGDEAPDVALQAQVEFPAASGTFVASGAPPVDERWMQLRVEGGDWVPMGFGSMLSVGNIPADSYAAVYVRWLLPMTANALNSAAWRWDLVGWSRAVISLGVGHSESSPDGVLRRIGDRSFSGLIVGSTAYTDGGTSVGAPYEAWCVDGVPYAAPAETITVNDTDSAAATLSAGQEYTALVVMSASGRTLLKGVKAAIGASVDPTVPAGSFARARIVRDDTEVTSIEMLVNPDRFSFWATGGLNGKLGPGAARQANALTGTRLSREVSFTASSTNRIWALPDNEVDVTTTAAVPTPGALLLWEAVTDGSAITSIVDRRRFIGPEPVRFSLRLGSTLAADAVSGPEVNNTGADLYLDPERSITVALDDLGSSAASGETRIDLQTSAAGAAWASLYAGDNDMPDLAWDGTDPVVTEGFPDVLVIAKGARFRARVDAIPSGGTAPSGAVVVVEGYQR
jgi:hypothetical protein